MIGSFVADSARRWATLGLGLLACISAEPVSAADCPGHPDALGTSRTLVVDPREHPRIGTMQYPETLPLEDHEVVLTFDDGPLPRNSDQVLEILAAQCVKATFFTIGKMAQSFPEGVRKLRDAGHTIATHSWNHPLNMNKMPIERARQQIDDGIAAATAALGDATALAPFFRIPGLARAADVEEYLASQGIQVWSADFLADDWRHISSSRVYDLAMKRLEEKGRGILLLHDIQARTVAALPRILHDLKAEGYRIVHVVPATPELPATPSEPQQWQLHPPSEAVAISHWPKIPNFVFAEDETLAAPALSDLGWDHGQLAKFAVPFGRARARTPEVSWPQLATPPQENAAITLPMPSEKLFEIRDKPALPRSAVVASSGSAERETTDRARSASADDSRHGTSRKGRFGHPRVAHGRRAGASRVAVRGKHDTAHAARRGTLKHLVQVKKRNV